METSDSSHSGGNSAEAEAPGVSELSYDVVIVDVSGVADQGPLQMQADLIHIVVICS